MSSAEVKVVEKPEPWTAEEIATAIRMWTDSRPSMEIAAAIGKTRNAVIGRMHRIGCVRGKGIVEYSVSPKLVEAELVEIEAGSTPSPEPAPPPVPLPPPINDPEPEPEDAPQPLHSLDQMFTDAAEQPRETPREPAADPEPIKPADPLPVQPADPVPEETPGEPVQPVDPVPLSPVAEEPPKAPVEPVTFPEQVDLPNGQGKTPRPMTNLYDAPPEEGIPLLKVTGARCRYPMWSDMSALPIEQKHVCGHRTVGITSWCEKHLKIVFEPPKQRR